MTKAQETLLTGLDGSNSLAFLAALGTLRAVTRLDREGPAAPLDQRDAGGECRPVEQVDPPDRQRSRLQHRLGWMVVTTGCGRQRGVHGDLLPHGIRLWRGAAAALSERAAVRGEMSVRETRDARAGVTRASRASPPINGRREQLPDQSARTPTKPAVVGIIPRNAINTVGLLSA